ncbi:MAG: tetratricopeptide repeat protein, partial [Alphaproteobacteria bacterium]|nr:tetratricopeptide repeat protein [Alphaproteobacteria bacterium]
DWAMTQNNLGTALQALGEREQDTTRLLAAVIALEAALEVRTRKAAPDWAMTQNNLGTALQALGEREQDTTRLLAAVTAYEAAIEVHTRKAAPVDWAGTQNNLGTARRWLAEFKSDQSAADQAKAAFDLCLLEWTQESVPYQWAITQWNLADLALVQHMLASDPDHLALAQSHLDAARAIFAEGPSDHQLARCEELQGKIDAAQGNPQP